MAVFGWETFASFFSTPVRRSGLYRAASMDIRNKGDVEKVFFEISPKIVINTAAVSDFNQCENDGELSWEVNFNGTKNIMAASEKIGARLIHISTDLVFDGLKGNYTEEDIPTPLSNYGKSKLAADNYILSNNSNYCVLRPSLIYGWSLNTSRSFIEKIIQGIQNQKIYYGFVDECRNPIYVANLCEIILKVGKNLSLNGLYHVCGPKSVSRYDFALKTCDVFGMDKSLVIPSTADDYVFSSLRPKDCSMKNTKIESALQEKILGIDDGLNEMKQFPKNGGGQKNCCRFRNSSD